MVYSVLNERCEKILNILLEKKDFTDLETLAKETQVSKRSVYYDIYKINDFLEENDCCSLVIERGKGIFLSPEERKQIETLLKKQKTTEAYVFLPSERIKIILCYLILKWEPIYIRELMDLCMVSRNTVFSDLKNLTTILHEFELDLDYNSKNGYKIQGDVIKARSLFFLYFNEIRYLYDNGILMFNTDQKLENSFLKRLESIEKKLQCKYVEGNLSALALLLPAMHESQDFIDLDGINEEEIMETKEYSLVQKEFDQLPIEEQLYLTLHLLGSRVTKATDDIFHDEMNEEIYQLTKSFVTEFERIACIGFDNKEELERSLFLHICSSMYRYRFGIQMDNYLSHDIIKAYPSLFQITKSTVKYLEKNINLPIPDSEVALLSLHFGAHLKISKEKKDVLRIVILCANGIATTNMLKREVARLLPDAIITSVLYHKEFINLEEDYDLVISSMDIEGHKPVIKVRPILSDSDKQKILNHPVVTKRLNHSMDIKVEKEKGEGLASYLGAEKIRLISEKINWEDSIKLAGESLVALQHIKASYLEKIISQTNQFGNYMFITDGVFLAHARPEDGVNKLDISLSIFKDPVAFPNDEPCELLWVLAAENQESHLQILKDIFTLVSEKENISKLLRCQNEREVLSLIHETVQ